MFLGLHCKFRDKLGRNLVLRKGFSAVILPLCTDKLCSFLSEKMAANQDNQSSDLEFRSFWKAGGYDVGSTKQIHEQGHLEHARVHPKFLHSNATSHKWAFGAIAELLDNAVDEICKGATFVKLDKILNTRDHNPALLFQDNGGGMNPEAMRQCMSLGYSMKKENTIGQYGNGFKTSTMRLGADVIVFSRTTRGSHGTQSIGLLSYTFLRKTGQDDVIVPMIDFECSRDHTKPIIYGSQDDWSNNLKVILEWSPFASEQELMLQFEDIGTHGTKIIVYNLWLNDDGLMELDFDNDEEDIRLRDQPTQEKRGKSYNKYTESHISYHMRFSLRAYASILYLRKFENFSIILRGKPVKQYNVVDDLKYSEVVMYRPNIGKASKEVSVKTEVGFVKEAPLLPVSGFNVYHKNRLIRAFWKVSSDGTNIGNGVVGVLEANFIEPAHDKQDFERSVLFLRLETRLKQICLDFWKSHIHLLGIYSGSTVVPRTIRKESPTQPFKDSTTELHRGFGADQAVIGLSANMQQGSGNWKTGHGANMCIEQPTNGLAAQDNLRQENIRCTSNLSEQSGHHGLSKAAPVDCSGSAVVDQICEENIQLFMRCEDHRQKETELKQTVETLEMELEETKRKCARLSALVENHKKLKNRTQVSGRAL